MKIIDCFTFYNEFDMLTYRLNLLFPYVDHFIIVESPQTHIGKEKPLYFKENIAKYEKFASKILHVVKHLPFKYPCNIEKREQWENETAQRDAIAIGLKHLNLDKEDIIIVSDVDEIPNPLWLFGINNNMVDQFDFAELHQDFYYYNFKCKFSHTWFHSKIMKYGYFIQSNLTLSKLRGIAAQVGFADGGWHLSNFGDAEFISNKLKNFGHQEYNDPEYTNISKIEDRIKNSKDLFDREDHNFEIIPIEKNTHLPPFYEIYLAKFI